jgi:hypothetical protein
MTVVRHGARLKLLSSATQERQHGMIVRAYFQQKVCMPFTASAPYAPYTLADRF